MKKLLCIILLFLFLTANVGQAQFNDSEPIFGQMLNLGHWSTDGLVFYWRGIDAGNLVDESFYGNHATFGAGAASPTWVGGSLYFDGGDYAVAASPTPVSGSFTVIAIAKVTDTSAQRTIIGTRSNNAFQLRFTTGGGSIGALVGNGVDWLDSTCLITFTVVLDHWYHIAYTVNSTGYRAYLDGVYKTSEAWAADTPLLMGSSNNLAIGARREPAPDELLVGNIAYVAIYNRVLSDNAIAELYINPGLPMQHEPIWLMYSPAAPSGIVPIIQAHTRRRRAG